MVDLTPLSLSLKVAVVATAGIFPVGVGTACWLALGPRFRGKPLVEAALSLPLVMPPTVTGFGLLLLFGRGTVVGRWVNDVVGIHLVFTWEAAAIAAAVMGFPLLVRSATAAFSGVDESLLEAGRSLGANNLKLLYHVVIPLGYRGLFAGTTLAFARALGEFGATLIVAGSIPGETQTLPLALYDAVQTGNNSLAFTYAALLSITAFAILGVAGAYQGLVGHSRGATI